ncbi:hypothetical protein R5R35_001963 [Gryllus longicercus]|uniref:Uncharacterized protein n=1 Tax=Gryllus longicercus TaxID=2509291 RepID=A0AAN9ZE40_9ORTH
MEGPTVLVVPASSPGAADGGGESLLEVHLLGKGLRALRGNQNSIAAHHAQEALRCGASETEAFVVTTPHPHFLDFLARRKIFQISAMDVNTIGSFQKMIAFHDTWVMVLEAKDVEELLVESKAKGLSGELYKNVRDIVKFVEKGRNS